MPNLVILRQGEDITLFFKEKDGNGTLVDLDNYTNIIAYLWTSPPHLKKFSREVKEGYNLIERISSTEYSVHITAEITKYMNEGSLFLEIMVIAAEEHCIFKGTVCKLEKSFIKSEV